MADFVSYARVSTDKQSDYGHGLDAQEGAIRSFLRDGDKIVASFVETGSGRNNERPQLTAALAECRRRKCALIVGKLDRLSRSVAFLAQLLATPDVKIIIADQPNADIFRLHIEACIAEEELRKLSARTREGLAAAKAKGVRLGSPVGFTRKAVDEATKSRISRADQHARDTEPMLALARLRGNKSNSAIARFFMAREVLTPRGSFRWTSQQVQNLCNRLEVLNAAE